MLIAAGFNLWDMYNKNHSPKWAELTISMY